MSNVTIYHNPRCSKSRQTLALLEQKNIPTNIVLYLQSSLSEVLIKQLQHQLGFASLKDMMRTKEAVFKELSLENASEQQLLTALVAHPKLLERPIVVVNNTAKIGRPPENVLEILS